MGKCNLTIEQLKNILYRIFEEEKRRENLEITLSDIYSFKYFNTAIFNKKLILIHSWHDLTTFINCLSITLRSIRTPAYYSYGKKNIVIVLDFYVLSPLIGKIINRCKFLINTKFSFALFTIYHELKHAMQEKSFQNHDYFTFDNIVFEMETNIIKWFRTHYSQNHDDYYMESDANVYGISRAEEYCRKHPNLVTEEDKALIRKRKKNILPT